MSSLSRPSFAISFGVCLADVTPGGWPELGSHLQFGFPPQWWAAALWFKAVLVTVIVLVAVTIHYFRLRQVRKSISARYDQRLKERTRMARELHDTLLQTIQGSKIVADDALDHPGDPGRVRRAVEQLSVWLGQAAEEGRAALNSLSAPIIEKNDLAEALRRATEDDLIPRTMSVSFSVVGDAREMHRAVRDEVYRIGYEAIHNASRHSRASRLEVQLKYAQNLTVRVKDSGIGIDPAVVDRRMEGHLGLQRMRERSARIGAKLTLVSSAASGTEVELIVPGSVIFRESKPTPFEKIRSFRASNLGRSRLL